MSAGLYSGVSALALGTGLYKGTQGLWGGSSGLVNEFGASLALDFLAGAPLDSRITFSRTTNATLVDATGRVTYAPNNLMLRSEESNTAPWTRIQASVIANVPGIIAPNDTETADFLQENTANSEHYDDQTVAVTAGVTYFYSRFYKGTGAGNRIVWHRVAGAANAGVTFNPDTLSGIGGASFVEYYPNGWIRVATVFTAASTGNAILRAQIREGAVSPGVSSYLGNGSSGFYTWGAQLEAVTYQTLPSTYVQTVASAYYGPRFDYDPVTLAPRGLLIEEQRVNLVTYSQEPSNAAWSKVRSSITADVMIAPDGTLTGDKLVEDTSVTNTHRISVAGISMTSGTSYTWSIFLKAGERTSVVVALNSTSAGNAFGSNPLFFVDLLTGAITSVSASVTASSAVLFPNGWWRVSVSATATLTTTNFPTVLLAEGGTNAYTGDGVSGAFLWGGQVEAASFPTSYIPTVASTVTRAADSVAITGTNFSSWYNQSEGTIVFSGDSVRPASLSPGTRLFQFDNATTANVIRTQGQSTLVVFDASVLQAIIASTPLILYDGTVFKFASAYKLDDFATVTTGAVATDTSGTVPTATQLTLGNGAGGAFINGHIRTFTFYPQRLANEQLQALTS